MRGHNVLTSSKSDEYPTPQWIFKMLDDEFNFTLDPCSDGANNKCDKFYTKESDGLLQNWGNEIVFMNPPYSKISDWMQKAYESSQGGATVVCLIPARTCTKWWHSYCIGAELRFIKGRLKFGSEKNSAPFPSVVVILKANHWPTVSIIERAA